MVERRDAEFGDGKARARLAGAVLLLLGGAGCGGGAAGPADTTDAVTTPTNASSSLPGPETVVSGFVHGPDGRPLARASVCVKDTNACATSGDDGSFLVTGVDADVYVMLTFEKQGFLPSLRALLTQEFNDVLPPGENTLFPVTAPQTFMGATAAADAGGYVAFFVTTPDGGQPVPSVSVTLSGTDGAPYAATYVDDGGLPIANATAGARGGFAGLPQGLYGISFGASGATCTTSSLYGFTMTDQQPAAGQASLVVPVIDGYVTTPVSASCVSTP
jgi:hypothetical protein